MQRLAVLLLLAGLWVGAQAGSGLDLWGKDTLINYPPGEGRKTVPVQANDDGVQVPIAVKCQCSDADPRTDVDQTVTYDCFYQRLFGNCNMTYMFDANAELAPEGFCQMSCSRCNCCSPPFDVLQSLGASRFLQALEAAQPSLKENFQHPGYMNTILVPTDAAWDAALEKYGNKLTQPTVLQEVLKFHILPPEPTRRGLWTSPFFSLGPKKLYTAYDGPSTLSTKRFQLPNDVTWEGGITGFTIDGPFNSANVIKSDIPSCKSYLTVIDSVLLPFNPSTLPPEDWLLPSGALGVEGCFVQPNGLITGNTIKAGASNLQASIGACCDSCKSTPTCNAWIYCSQKGGCLMADGTAYMFGFCELKTSTEVAARLPANYSDFSTFTVPFISGYIEVPAPVPGTEAASTTGEPVAPVAPKTAPKTAPSATNEAPAAAIPVPKVAPKTAPSMQSSSQRDL